MATKAKASSSIVLQMRRGMPLVAVTTPANGDAHAASPTDEAPKRSWQQVRGNPKRRPKTLAADRRSDEFKNLTVFLSNLGQSRGSWVTVKFLFLALNVIRLRC